MDGPGFLKMSNSRQEKSIQIIYDGISSGLYSSSKEYTNVCSKNLYSNINIQGY